MALDRKDAIRYEGHPYNRFVFNCTECDAEIFSQHSYLEKHSGKCGSCCRRTTPYAAAYGRLVHNTKTRGIEVNLTPEEFSVICLIPNCHYCGETINRSLVRGEKGYRGYFVDRMDNSIGYTASNCVPCCWPCNQAKGSRYTYEEFLMISNQLRLFRTEQSAPHWRDEFMWSDGDESPNPYMPMEMYPT